jgi:peroxiredoxin
MESVEASSGWGVLHLFYRVDHERAEREPGGAKRVLDAINALEDDGVHHALVFAVLGHKADVGVMAIGPDLARLQRFQHELTGAPLVLTWSYVSLTEGSEYTATEDDERVRIAAEESITDPAEVDAMLSTWRERIAKYREQRIHPKLPQKKAICFYPMSKRRTGADNWYALEFDER